MEDKRICKGLFIPIEIWEDKNLTWNEKILFIEIDSLTSKDKDCFFSNEYISKLLGVTENSANRILSSLIDKGYVVKTKFDGRKRYVKTAFSCNNSDYSQMNKQTILESQGSLNNEEYIINNINNNKKDNDKSLSKKDDFFEECWKAYRRKGSKKKSQIFWNKLTHDEQILAKAHIEAYVIANPDVKYQKDFERYLRDKVFTNVVYKGNAIIFDPDRMENKDIYNPQLDGFNLFWNENKKIYIAMYDLEMLVDGYTADNRPSSARVMRNSKIYHWNTQNRKWEVE